MAVNDDGEIIEFHIEKLKLGAGVEETHRLQNALRDVARVLEDAQPDAVRILLPEQTYKDSYARIAPRVALETIVRIACLRANVPVEMLRRVSARSRLGMPKKGRFDEAMTEAVGPPVGRYWASGRGLAAAAALAEDAG